MTVTTARPAPVVRSRTRLVLGELCLLAAAVAVGVVLLADLSAVATEVLLVAAVVDVALGVALLRRR